MSSGKDSESWANRTKQSTAEVLHAGRQYVQGESLTDRTKDKCHEGARKMGVEAPSMLDKVKGSVESGYETLKEKSEQVWHKLGDQTQKAKQSGGDERPGSLIDSAKQRTGEALGRAEDTMHEPNLTQTRGNEPESFIEEAGRKIGDVIKGAGDFVRHKASTK